MCCRPSSYFESKRWSIGTLFACHRWLCLRTPFANHRLEHWDTFPRWLWFCLSTLPSSVVRWQLTKLSLVLQAINDTPIAIFGTKSLFIKSLLASWDLIRFTLLHITLSRKTWWKVRCYITLKMYVLPTFERLKLVSSVQSTISNVTIVLQWVYSFCRI